MIMHGASLGVAPDVESAGRAKFAAGLGVDVPRAGQAFTARGQQPRPLVRREGWIEEDHVIPAGIAGEMAARVGGARFEPRPHRRPRGFRERFHQFRIAIDRHRPLSAARQRLKGQRPASGIEVQRVLAGQVLAEPVEHRFAYAVWRRAQAHRRRKADYAAAESAADDADTVGGGEHREGEGRNR